MSWDSAPLVELADAITAAGLPAALDPADVATPGAWITLDRLRRGTVGGGVRLEVSVYLVAPDLDPRRALDELAAAYALVVPGVFTPDGATESTGVILPGDPTPLPGLRIPVYLYTD